MLATVWFWPREGGPNAQGLLGEQALCSETLVVMSWGGSGLQGKFRTHQRIEGRRVGIVVQRDGPLMTARHEKKRKGRPGQAGQAEVWNVLGNFPPNRKMSGVCGGAG